MRYILVYDDVDGAWTICKRTNKSVDEYYTVFLKDIDSKQIAKDTLDTLLKTDT